LETRLLETWVWASEIRVSATGFHRGRDFRAIRYVLPDGRRRGEVIQRGVTSDIVTDISSELFTADPTLQEAFSLGQIGEVYLSPVISNGTSETLFLYVPVRALTRTSVKSGAIQLEMDPTSITRAVKEALDRASIERPGRAILLVNNVNQIVARASGEIDNEASILSFLLSNPGSFNRQSLTGNTMLSAQLARKGRRVGGRAEPRGEVAPGGSHRRDDARRRRARAARRTHGDRERCPG
jgi:hypothetical protein